MKKYLLLLCLVGCKTKNEHKIYKIAVVFSNGDKDTLQADLQDPERAYLWNGNLHCNIHSDEFMVVSRDTRIASFVRSFKILK